MNEQGIEWNDIPFVLAVCETGTLSGAAKKLGVHYSTVLRRIEGVESKLDVTLFERSNTGYIMTPEGERFYHRAIALRNQIDGIQNNIAGQDTKLEGTLVVTTTDTLLYVLSEAFAQFQEQYPEVELRLLTGSRRLDLVQKDADIALRPTLTPPEHWIGRSLATLSYATYASQEYIDKMAQLTSDKYHWISLVDDLNRSEMNKMTQKLKHPDANRTTASSLMSVYELAIAGNGIAALPCFLGDYGGRLLQVHETMSEFNCDLWLLAHPDMRRSARINAFFEFITPLIRNQLTSNKK
ncbi:LysR family transcriptional regulator [Vibrio sp. S4M6]|uniref:LysR family transcriptional regulator n=1 Tax=Vibrio sinus TaxID=2946865 RepID=UPI002029E816|nr:LysR family transcriptional regulator [Vibrio sinus]MCL9782412.1 LysR family transcriptional regulator [Vibrio sinus]